MIAFLVRPVTNTSSSAPALIASITAYWISGLSTTGSISLGLALVAGRKRVPRPATGNTAFLMGIVSFCSSGGGLDLPGQMGLITIRAEQREVDAFRTGRVFHEHRARQEYRLLESDRQRNRAFGQFIAELGGAARHGPHAVRDRALEAE